MLNLHLYDLVHAVNVEGMGAIKHSYLICFHDSRADTAIYIAYLQICQYLILWIIGFLHLFLLLEVGWILNGMVEVVFYLLFYLKE
jgi:hypothetical protein